MASVSSMNVFSPVLWSCRDAISLCSHTVRISVVAGVFFKNLGSQLGKRKIRGRVVEPSTSVFWDYWKTRCAGTLRTFYWDIHSGSAFQVQGLAKFPWINDCSTLGHASSHGTLYARWGPILSRYRVWCSVRRPLLLLAICRRLIWVVYQTQYCYFVVVWMNYFFFLFAENCGNPTTSKRHKTLHFFWPNDHRQA